MEDLYAVLGIAPGATADQVRSAYVAGIRRTHPDIEGGDEDQAKRLTAAYSVLSDTERRAAYDRRRGRYIPSTPQAAHRHAETRPRRPAESCATCGSSDGDGFTIRTGTGRLTVRRVVVYDGQPCAACAKAALTDLESRNLMRGARGMMGMLAALGYQVTGHAPDGSPPMG